MPIRLKRRHFIKACGGSAICLAFKGSNLLAEGFFPGPVYEAGIKSSEIDERFAQSVSSDKQLMSQWCWAASISMAFGFHGHEVHQETIVKRIKGIAINLPAHGAEITEALKSSWTDVNGKTFKSKCWVFDLESGKTNRDNRDVIRELKAKRPLVYGSNGHAVLLTDVKYTKDFNGFPWPHFAVVRDPWPGKGKRALEFRELRPIYVAGVQIESE